MYYRENDATDPFYDIYASADWLDPMQRALVDFPLFVELEVTNRCNLDCIFCLHQRIEDMGNMPFATFKKIIDETSEHGAALRIHGWGEPLAHKDAVKQVRYAQQKGVPTKLFTNGILLTEKSMLGFIEAGLTELQFSMQGLNKQQYEAMRVKARYEDFRAKVLLAHEIRTREGSARPYISILTSIINSDLDTATIDGFKAEWLPYVDKLAVDYTMFDFVKDSGRVKQYLPFQRSGKEYRPCVDTLLKITIHWNGDIKVCNNDYASLPEYTLGNILDMTLHEAWHSEKMSRHRQLVVRDLAHARLQLCKDCFTYTSKYDYLKGEKKEPV